MPFTCSTRRHWLGMSAGMLAAAVIPGNAGAMDTRPSPDRTRSPRPTKPLVLGHRGCPALRPEHTLASYAKAIEDGADFIEPDLVATKDGILIARHENNITETTDVSGRPEFADRKATRVIDGVSQSGWFTEDFTFAEIRTLRARERLGARRPFSQSFDGQFPVARFDEIVEFVAAEASARGRTIGLIPEIKHATYFRSIGLPLEERLLRHFDTSPWLRQTPVVIQSFEVTNLKALRQHLAGRNNVRLMQLIGERQDKPADLALQGTDETYARMLTREGLSAMATYADFVAPNSREVIPLLADGSLGKPTGLVANAHAAGLLVGIWTMRPENSFLPRNLRDGAGDDARNPKGSVAEIGAYLAAGVDAFFTDDPALGRKAVDTFHH